MIVKKWSNGVTRVILSQLTDVIGDRFGVETVRLSDSTVVDKRNFTTRLSAEITFSQTIKTLQET